MIDERVRLHLGSMSKAAASAILLAQQTSYDDFVLDPDAQAATAMYLILIGEGASKISQRSPEFVTANPALPWERMRGLRNRIVHDYETLHLPTIWSTVKDALPSLLADIEALLHDHT
jgi:uncharacterized protein with HEPN domain